MTRQEANFKIITLLTDYIYRNPDVRFTQALFNLGINEFKDNKFESNTLEVEDKYNEESVETLKTVQNNV